MSTILRSLKRLEKEKESYGGPASSLLSPHAASQAMHRRVKFAWLQTKFFRWAVAAMIVLTSISVLYAYLRPNKAPHKIQPQTFQTQHPEVPRSNMAAIPRQPDPMAKAQPPMEAPAQAASHPSVPMPLAPIPISQPSAPMAPAAIPQVAPVTMPNMEEQLAKLEQPAEAPATQEMQETAPDQNDQPPPDEEKPTIAPQIPLTKPDPAPSAKLPADLQPGPMTSAVPSFNHSKTSPRPALNPAQPRPQPPPAASQDSNLFANAERMTDGRLKVQAIVWAPAPADRMAVVNSNVVREGGTLEGFSVVGIGEDAVYVREGGGRLLKVPFGK